jgi:SSS family solute:Na+ symporter
MENTAFSWGIIVFLLGTLGIGVWASKQIKGDSVNFLVAGRGLALPLAAATLMAQSVDSNATLGNTDLSSEFGFWAGASLPVGLSLCLLLTGLFLAKPMNRMGLITIPDFYRVKYGRTVELIAACIMSVSFSFLLAGNLVAGGYMFQNFLGLSYFGGITLLLEFRQIGSSCTVKSAQSLEPREMSQRSTDGAPKRWTELETWAWNSSF